MARRLEIGKRLICYITRVSRWADVLEIASPTFEDSSPRSVLADDAFIIRFKVATLVWLPINKCVPIKEKHIWDHLTFTKVSDSTSAMGWTGRLRRSLNRLNDQDGRFLEHLLVSQSKNGIDFPQDADEWQKLIAKPIYRVDKTVVVTVPVDTLDDVNTHESIIQIRESHWVQAQLAAIGETKGFKVWIPKNDRASVL